MDLNLSISNRTVSTKFYDKRDGFDFDIGNFPFLDGDVPRSTSYGVSISQLIRFARESSNVSDISCRNKALTAKPLSRVIVIIVRFFLSFIADTVSWLKNIMLACGNFSNKAYQNKNFMLT